MVIVRAVGYCVLALEDIIGIPCHQLYEERLYRATALLAPPPRSVSTFQVWHCLDHAAREARVAATSRLNWIADGFQPLYTATDAGLE